MGSGATHRRNRIVRLSYSCTPSLLTCFLVSLLLPSSLFSMITSPSFRETSPLLVRAEDIKKKQYMRAVAAKSLQCGACKALTKHVLEAADEYRRTRGGFLGEVKAQEIVDAACGKPE
eukprot:UC4_evm1s933